MMLVVLLAATLAQAPAEAPVVLANPTVDAPPCGDVKLAVQFIDRHLLSVGFEVGFASSWVARSAERGYRPGELREGLRLVPHAFTLADRADGEFRLGVGFTVAGLVAQGLSLVASVVLVPLVISSSTTAAVTAVLITAFGGLLVGAALSLIGSVFLQAAQQHGLEAVSEYNHGLTRMVLQGCDGAAAQSAPLLLVPLP